MEKINYLIGRIIVVLVVYLFSVMGNSSWDIVTWHLTSQILFGGILAIETIRFIIREDKGESK